MSKEKYALFTDGSCLIVGKLKRWKATVWSLIQEVIEATEWEGESSQFAGMKDIQPALDIVEWEKWLVLHL